MTPETVNLIDRLYPEIRDDLLTALVGGVVNEPIIFDEKIDLYRLAQTASEVRSVTGTRTDDDTHEAQRYTFQKEIDFVFSQADSAIIWQKGGKLPDDDSIFYVDYFIPDSRSPITDINVGSVSRTITEAIGREIAVVYQQINQAYRAGFVDTAEGKSLDLVVAILGITRKKKGAAVGQVTFFRDPAVDGSITIGEDTLVSTTKGDVSFVTTEMRTLQRGQVRIDVPIRATEKFKGKDGIVPAGAITTLLQPIAGISRVTNFDATALGVEDETDDELRARAKAALRASGKGTLAALARVILENRAKLTEVWDPNSPPTKQTPPGQVTLLIETEPERFPSLQAAVEETRAAGVQTTLVARYIYFKPRLAVKLVPTVSATGKPKVIEDIIAAIQTYVDGLSSGDPVKAEDLLKAIAGVKEVEKKEGKPNVRIVDVMTWQSDLGKPGTASLTDALLTAVQAVPASDAEALRSVIAAVLAEDAPALIPTGRRIPNRKLVQTPTGEPAKDGDIEAGRFQVSATIGSEKWWIVLDLQPTDIVLVESER